ncbi:MAG: hypothetical protein V3R55_02875 [Alphaproteobacteria bacterium]
MVWSLGANDAANLFGTPAVICIIFVMLGAVIGISLLKGGKGIRWRILGGIGVGWILAPIIAGLIFLSGRSFGPFFLQNVFDQQVFRAVP